MAVTVAVTDTVWDTTDMDNAEYFFFFFFFFLPTCTRTAGMCPPTATAMHSSSTQAGSDQKCNSSRATEEHALTEECREKKHVVSYMACSSWAQHPQSTTIPLPRAAFFNMCFKVRSSVAR